jgi:mannose-1-phosphate guanylyltransferase
VLTAGLEHAQAGRLITFGIVPQKAETGYGYIKMGDPLGHRARAMPAVTIAAFVEKPDLETAKRYVASKAYCWNSGMFMFKASRVFQELETVAPDIVVACRQAIEKGVADLDFFRLDKALFLPAPAIPSTMP